MYRTSIYLATSLILAMAVAPARADTIVVQDSDGTDPNTVGFTGPNGETAPGSAGAGTWNISGAWCCSYDIDELNSADVLALNAAPTWTFTTTFANLSTDTAPADPAVPEGYGSYATVVVSGVRFDLGLHSDGSGDQVLSVDPFSPPYGTGPGPDYTIPDLGTNPVTLSVLYNNTTETGDIYVNGVDVIQGFAGNSYADPNLNAVFFGGEDGEFSNVELSYADSNLGFGGLVSSVPEPRSLPLFLAALCIAGLAGRRFLSSKAVNLARVRGR
jgi:hypothetical protein